MPLAAPLARQQRSSPRRRTIKRINGEYKTKTRGRKHPEEHAGVITILTESHSVEQRKSLECVTCVLSLLVGDVFFWCLAGNVAGAFCRSAALSLCVCVCSWEHSVRDTLRVCVCVCVWGMGTIDSPEDEDDAGMLLPVRPHSIIIIIIIIIITYYIELCTI